MARSKNHSKKSDHKPAQRDRSPIASPRLLSPTPSPFTVSRTLPALVRKPAMPALPLVEDRRRFNPEQRNQPAKTVSGRLAPIILSDRPRQPKTKLGKLAKALYGPEVHSQTKAAVTFAVPSSTIVCLRRQRRKEVLFAAQKTGSGSRAKKRNRSWLSKISCR